MKGRFSITSRTVPDCETFLTIKWPGEAYVRIDEFIRGHADVTDNELYSCFINYRGNEKTYKEYIEEYVSFTEKLELANVDSFKLIAKESIKAALYFADKATDCLQNARYFTMKARQLLDTNYNLRWEFGYIPQFSLRCTFFGTAATWYSNTFDQLLQAVYWAYELFTSAMDRDGNMYDDTWDVKKIMIFCTYEFVVGELKKRGHSDVRKLLTVCSSKIEETRMWANYIKHKGGIEYKHLEAAAPFEIYIMPVKEKVDNKTQKLDERFALKNFKSPIEVDIDEKMNVLVNTHIALVECITKTVQLIDFDEYQIKFGGR